MKAVFETCLGRMSLEISHGFTQEFGWTDEVESVPDEMLEIVQRVQFALVTNDTIPLEAKMEGTEFQQLVWREIQNVDFGETISYQELAVKIGRPKAFRAVASACGKNRVALVVPCHRIIKNDGQVGKYRWGSERKNILLDLESANC